MGGLADIASCKYLAFVSISLAVYWRMSKRHQWIVLLLSSLLFYFLSAPARTMFFVGLSVVSVHVSAVWFEWLENQRMRRVCLVAALAFNIALLAALRYGGRDGGNHAPLAINFYTFQLLAYLLDAYWGVIKPERNILKTLLYAIYFPLMVSGPICRYGEVGERLTEGFVFDYDMVLHGVGRVAWGFLKKVVIANRLTVVVSALWQDVASYSGIFVWLSAFLYVLELYMDFSGCMDIVLGVSECFGIRLPENFRSPLFSRTVREIWQRWHITLGSWAKNYVMYPLQKSAAMASLQSKIRDGGGKRAAKKATAYLSALAVWLFVGGWHGKEMKYILGEGLWFWIVITLGDMARPWAGKWKTWRWLQTARTCLLFSIGMMAFHSNSLGDFFYRLRMGLEVTGDFGTKLHGFWQLFVSQEVGGVAGLAMMALGGLMVWIVDWLDYQDEGRVNEFCFKRHPAFGHMIMALITGLILFSVNIAPQEFIYAQF